MTRPDLEAGPAPRAELGLAALLALAGFALYAVGACPTIYVGDSGELVAAAHTLGIPHPSGYPLYVLLGKLWTLLVPLGSVAYRMSLFSALFAGIAVGLLFLAARALGVGRLAAAGAAVAFAVSPSFWGEANVQRVYSLNACFVALATLLAMRWWAEGEAPISASEASSHRSFHRRDRLFINIALVCGIGAANHTFLAVWGASFFVFAALVVDRSLLRRARTLLAAAAAALLGLSIYGFLVFRSRQDPRLDWSDPESIGRALGGGDAAGFLVAAVVVGMGGSGADRPRLLFELRGRAYGRSARHSSSSDWWFRSGGGSLPSRCSCWSRSRTSP